MAPFDAGPPACPDPSGGAPGEPCAAVRAMTNAYESDLYGGACMHMYHF